MLECRRDSCRDIDGVSGGECRPCCLPLQLGRYEPAATIAGYAANPMTEATTPETGTAIDHLREILGDQTYESLA